MKLTNKQKIDLESIEYFIPKNCAWSQKNDEDIQKFFEYSDQGKHKEDVSIQTYLPEGRTYFHALYWGKVWRGRHMEMYEEGVLSGDMPYHVLLGGFGGIKKRKWWQFWKPKFEHYHKPIPRSVVDFMKKEMFKGIDADIIENCYQTLLN